LRNGFQTIVVGGIIVERIPKKCGWREKTKLLCLRGTTNEQGNEILLSITCGKVTEQILIFHTGYSPWSW